MNVFMAFGRRLTALFDVVENDTSNDKSQSNLAIFMISYDFAARNRTVFAHHDKTFYFLPVTT